MDKQGPSNPERPLTHLLVSGLGWIPVDRGDVKIVKVGNRDRYQWEAEGSLITLDVDAVIGSKRAKVR